jgi:hypothetical protein
MQPFKLNRLVPFVFAALIASGSAAFADQVLKTLPGGDGKDMLKSPVDPVNVEGGGAIIRDDECAGKVGKVSLENGKPNPDYSRCVHDKIAKTRKKGTTQE